MIRPARAGYLKIQTRKYYANRINIGSKKDHA